MVSGGARSATIDGIYLESKNSMQDTCISKQIMLRDD
jgi:hypothetical protein